MSQSVIRIVPVALTLLGLVAVGSGSGGSRDTGTARLSDVLPRQLLGAWSRNVTPADFKRAGAPGYVIFAGPHSIVVKRNGDVKVDIPGTLDFIAGFSVLADRRLVIHRHPECPTAKGLYRWKVAGRLLTLTKLRDRCTPKVALFAGVWKRK